MTDHENNTDDQEDEVLLSCRLFLLVLDFFCSQSFGARHAIHSLHQPLGPGRLCQYTSPVINA